MQTEDGLVDEASSKDVATTGNPKTLLLFFTEYPTKQANVTSNALFSRGCHLPDYG